MEDEDRIKSLQARIIELEKVESRLRLSDELLGKSELQQKAILNNIPDIAWLKDKESRFIAVNEAFGRSCGFRPDELVGKTDLDIWPRDLAQSYRRDDREVMSSGMRKCVEEPLADKEGKVKWIETIKTPIYNDKGAVIGTTGIARDITERRKLEERLREAKAELEIRVKVRTAELTRANEDMLKMVSENEAINNKLSRISNCLAGLGANHAENIRTLVCLCGELLKPSCLLYNRLENRMLFTFASWNPPKGLPCKTDSEGHICNDIIKGEAESVVLIPNLPGTKYYNSDPYVKTYSLKTYMGFPVRIKGLSDGVLCAVYQADIIPSEQDKRIITLIGHAISAEEVRDNTERKLFASEKKFKDLFGSIQDVVALFYHKSRPPCAGNIFMYNPMAKDKLGYKEEELQLLKIDDLFSRESLALVKEKIRELVDKKSAIAEDILIKKKDGSIYYADILLSFASVEGEEYLKINIRDVTERKANRELLAKESDYFRKYLDVANVLIVALDANGKVTLINNKGCQLLGRPKEEVTGKDWFTNFIPQRLRKDVNAVFSEMICGRADNTEYFENPILTNSGQERIIAWHNTILRDDSGRITGTLSSGEDITERVNMQIETRKLQAQLIKSNEQLRELALRDSHTGLYNHRYMQDYIEAEFQRAKRNSECLAVIMLDIDYFKSINDVYGHQFGDLILKQFAGYLKTLVRAYDQVIRYGGEEFVIISSMLDRSQVLQIAHRILESVNAYSFGDDKHTIKLKLSLAVATYPEDNCAKGIGLINIADNILNKVKISGGNLVYSSADLDLGISEDLKHVSKDKKVEIKELKNKLDKMTKRSNQSLTESIFAFAKTIELKDDYTGKHVEDTVHFTTEICKVIGLPKEEVELIKQGAVLHDLGKIGISERILRKNSKLSKAEFAEIMKHPQIGADILRPIHFLHALIPLIFCHHERWDGKGYPSGLKGESIPIGARIISVADVYQALTSDRPYRKSYTKKQALKIIKDASGSQFDPKIVDAFLGIIKREKK